MQGTRRVKRKRPRTQMDPGARVNGSGLLPCGCLHVVDVVDGEWPHQDAQGVDVRPGRIFGDRVVTKPSRREALAFDALKRAGAEEVGDVIGQVPEVNEAPERELWRAAVLG